MSSVLSDAESAAFAHTLVKERAISEERRLRLDPLFPQVISPLRCPKNVLMSSDLLPDPNLLTNCTDDWGRVACPRIERGV